MEIDKTYMEIKGLLNEGSCKALHSNFSETKKVTPTYKRVICLEWRKDFTTVVNNYYFQMYFVCLICTHVLIYNMMIIKKFPCKA